MRKTKDTTERYIELPATTLRTASVLQSQKMRDALATAAHERELTTHRTLGFSADVLADHLSTTPPDTDAEFFDSRQISEAIVLLAGRPVLLVKDGVFEKASLPLLEKRLSSRRKALIDPIRAVGRV